MAQYRLQDSYEPRQPSLYTADQLSTKDQGQNDPASVSDIWLEGKISMLFSLNPQLRATGISVRVRAGYAQLLGTADTAACAELAARLARSVTGIRDVIPCITVAGSVLQSASRLGDGHQGNDHNKIVDEGISTTLRTHLLLNTDIDVANIGIDTRQQTIALTGSVSCYRDKLRIQQIAESIPQVSRVLNRLAVHASPAP